MHETILHTLAHACIHLGAYWWFRYWCAHGCVSVGLGQFLGSSDTCDKQFVVGPMCRRKFMEFMRYALSIGWPTTFWINMCDGFNCFPSHFCRQHVLLFLHTHTHAHRQKDCCYELWAYVMLFNAVFSSVSLSLSRFCSFFASAEPKKAATTKNNLDICNKLSSMMLSFHCYSLYAMWWWWWWCQCIVVVSVQQATVAADVGVLLWWFCTEFSHLFQACWF